MRRRNICLLVLLTLTVAITGTGYSHVPTWAITESEALAKATSIVAEIVQKGKLHSSWADIKPTQAQLKAFKNNEEWVITFYNPREVNPEKQTLYVFLDLFGEYLAASFTGK
jgi:hypothetical protein